MFEFELERSILNYQTNGQVGGEIHALIYNKAILEGATLHVAILKIVEIPVTIDELYNAFDNGHLPAATALSRVISVAAYYQTENGRMFILDGTKSIVVKSTSGDVLNDKSTLETRLINKVFSKDVKELILTHWKNEIGI